MKQRDRKARATVNGRQAKAKRRADRLARETPRELRRRAEVLVATAGEGSERIERMMANAPAHPRPLAKDDRVWVSRPCDCDPPRDHGPHKRKAKVVVDEDSAYAEKVAA